jgi:DNA-binding LacI/PurR family transcriptional regulator
MVIPTNPENAEDDFFTMLVKGVTHAAAHHHYDLLISAQLPDDDEMEAYRRIVGGNRVDGIILARTFQDDPRIAYLKQMDFPFAVSGRAAPHQVSNFPYIDADSQAGIHMLVSHFVAYGHKHIGLILPPPDIAYTEYRHAGYKDGLAEAGLPYRTSYVTHGNLKRSGGRTRAHALLEASPKLTAIIACNDVMAFGVISALGERGLTPGEDVAVGGFDDIPAAQHSIPSLTTVRQPIFEIGSRLAELLLTQISGEPPAEPASLLVPELIVRASSGQPVSNQDQ